ncbi:MAG: PPC domain-containing protein [Thermoguttaceae bacterium]|nr:PPC domain-containing protein [Thermoguttaceae bacterium]
MRFKMYVKMNLTRQFFSLKDLRSAQAALPGFFLGICACLIFMESVSAQAQTQSQSPSIGYVYPAGGQRGTTFRVLIGGRKLDGIESVSFSGNGVSARVLKRFRKMAINNPEEGIPARQLYEEEFGLLDVPESERSAKREELQRARTARLADRERTEEEKAYLTPEMLADQLPYFDELLNRHEPEDIQRVFWEYFFPRPERKPKETLSQGLLLEVTIAPDAPCGDRLLWVRTRNATSFPAVFQVGELPEVRELEPNDTPEPPSYWDNTKRKTIHWVRTQLPALSLPVMVNGQIRPGDADRFQFHAKAGERVVLFLRGRHLAPFLADAVPGWFQPLLTVYGPDGMKAASAVCWKNDPDPALVFKVPEDGVYCAEVQDSLFRGRDDFVYRLAIGTLPWIEAVYPPCVQEGMQEKVQLLGINLPNEELDLSKLTAFPNWDGVPMAEIRELGGRFLLRPMSLCVEKEAPKEAKAVQDAEFPSVFYGKLEKDGQTADFRFSGKAGEQIVIDVTAGALDSPLDARLELRDDSGDLVAECDDRAGAEGPNIGLRTHHADPILMVTLPKDGTFTVQLSNVLSKGDPANIYRIRFSRPEPSFFVLADEETFVFSHISRVLRLRVFRAPGFDAPLEVFSESPDFVVESGRIPAGASSAVCVVRVDPKIWPEGLKTDGDPAHWDHPLPLKVRAAADGPENVLTQPVWASVMREQAFIYFHQLPTRPLTCAFVGQCRRNGMVRISDEPVKIALEGETELLFISDSFKERKELEGVDLKELKPGKWRVPNYWFTLIPECEGVEVTSQDFFGKFLKLTVRVTDPEKAKRNEVLIFTYQWFRGELADPENPVEPLDGPQPLKPVDPKKQLPAPFCLQPLPVRWE